MTDQEKAARWGREANKQIVDSSLGAIGLGITYAAVWLGAFVALFFAGLLAILGLLAVLCHIVGA